MRCAQAAADIMGPNVGRQAIMAVVGHADRVGLVAPRDRDQHRAEDFLTRQPPVVRGVSKYGRDREVSYTERSLFRR